MSAFWSMIASLVEAIANMGAGMALSLIHI